MTDDEKPALHALVAYVSPVFGWVFCSDARVMPLADAVDYQRVGWAVLVDPADESELATWERTQRAFVQENRRRKKWFEAT